MKLTMEVLEGPPPVSELQFEGKEGENIMVGRDDVVCEADWRLNEKDMYVSRSHFILEIRPPNCTIRDPFSKNGTYLKRGEQPEEEKEEIFLQDGDQIRVGHTTLAVKLEVPEKKEKISLDSRDLISDVRVSSETIQIPDEPEEITEEEPAGELVRCIRCGEVLEDPPDFSSSKSIMDLDLMCSDCRAEVEAERVRKAEQAPQKEYYCMNSGCNKKLTRKANQDGRADEFQEVAVYLCDQCAEEIRKEAERTKGLDRKEIERYQILKELGRGGMGKVYLGAHKLTGRVAAVKVILPKIEVEESAFLRFQREISIMRHFQHSHLVRLYETSRENKQTHFISEFVAGGDLCQYISKQGKPLLEPERAVRIIAQALEGLEYFHTQADKYVHRDLKPENILIRRDNGEFTAKLADFGLARSYEKHGGTVTRAGEFAGTWFYMPPEQIEDFKECKPPTDIYSMGVTLYYLLTGELPLDLPAPWKVKAGKHYKIKKPPQVVVAKDDRISLGKRRSDLPRKLIRVVDKAIQKEARRRHQTAEAFRTDLLAAVD